MLVRARCTAVGAPEAAPCVRRRGRPLTRQDAAYSFVTTARPPADLSLSAVSAMLALSSTMLTVCTPCAVRAETDVSRQAQRWRRVASSRPRGGDARAGTVWRRVRGRCLRKRPLRGGELQRGTPTPQRTHV